MGNVIKSFDLECRQRNIENSLEMVKLLKASRMSGRTRQIPFLRSMWI